MLISLAASTCGETIIQRIVGWFRVRWNAVIHPGRVAELTVAIEPANVLPPVLALERPKAERTEPAPAPGPTRPPLLSRDEQRARKAAVRAVMLAREHRYDDAEEAFTEAAMRDPELDLTRVPTFWSLSNRGLLAAVRAYERAERSRDAAALQATIRYTFRPRPLPSRAKPVL